MAPTPYLPPSPALNVPVHPLSTSLCPPLECPPPSVTPLLIWQAPPASGFLAFTPLTRDSCPPPHSAYMYEVAFCPGQRSSPHIYLFVYALVSAWISSYFICRVKSVTGYIYFPDYIVPGLASGGPSRLASVWFLKSPPSSEQPQRHAWVSSSAQPWTPPFVQGAWFFPALGGLIAGVALWLPCLPRGHTNTFNPRSPPFYLPDNGT